MPLTAAQADDGQTIEEQFISYGDFGCVHRVDPTDRSISLIPIRLVASFGPF
jgi:hypothetical protein